MTFAAGTSAAYQLGRYEVRSNIGAGGMGDVYVSQDTDRIKKEDRAWR